MWCSFCKICDILCGYRIRNLYLWRPRSGFIDLKHSAFKAALHNTGSTKLGISRYINIVAKTCKCSPLPSIHQAPCIQIRSGNIKDRSMLTLTPFYCQNVDNYTRESFVHLKYRTFVGFCMQDCSFYRGMQNVFEATISHIMPLIVSKLNFAPVYFRQMRERP